MEYVTISVHLHGALMGSPSSLWPELKFAFYDTFVWRTCKWLTKGHNNGCKDFMYLKDVSKVRTMTNNWVLYYGLHEHVMKSVGVQLPPLQELLQHITLNDKHFLDSMPWCFLSTFCKTSLKFGHRHKVCKVCIIKGGYS
jgi:hypothetical protein